MKEDIIMKKNEKKKKFIIYNASKIYNINKIYNMNKIYNANKKKIVMNNEKKFIKYR